VAEIRRNLAAKPLKPPRSSKNSSARLQSRSIARQRTTANDAKDVPILAAAMGAGARLLVTHNIRHFRSGEGVRVLRPRTLIEEARAWMSSLGT
jgi:predicted nucleic acid-binding protein